MTKIKTNRNNTNNVPHLRFPEFSGEWEKNNLSKFSSKITKKNKGNVIQNVLCNSANLGIIPQNDYFDRDIANADNTDSYYIIEHGDFVYNPRKSTAAPYGPVNIYNGEKPGIISPLYLCFSVLNISPSFLFYRFKSSVWHPYVYSHGDTGVRFDRVSIKDDVFFDMPIYTPTQNEQEKIATLLSLIDERIATQNKIIEDLEQLKSALTDQLYSGQLRFHEFADDWGVSTFGHLTEHFSHRNRNSKHYPVFSVTKDTGFIPQEEQFESREIAGDDISSYKIIRQGEFAYNPARINVGSIARYDNETPCLISSLYVCIKPAADIDSDWLLYLLKSKRAIFYYNLYGEGGVRIYLFYPNFSRIKVKVPSIQEQHRIAALLKYIADKILQEKKLKDLYMAQKQFLLQRLFI